MSIVTMEKAPCPAKVNGRSVLLLRDEQDREAYIQQHPEVDPFIVCLVGIALFHNKRDREYVAASYFDEEGEEQWTRDFRLRELMIWMGGVALDEDDRRLLHLANRNHGTFAESYGWRPDVNVEWEPSPFEEEAFIQHELQDLECADGMPIEFFEGNENE